MTLTGNSITENATMDDADLFVNSKRSKENLLDYWVGKLRVRQFGEDKNTNLPDWSLDFSGAAVNSASFPHTLHSAEEIWLLD